MLHQHGQIKSAVIVIALLIVSASPLRWLICTWHTSMAIPASRCREHTCCLQKHRKAGHCSSSQKGRHQSLSVMFSTLQKIKDMRCSVNGEGLSGVSGLQNMQTMTPRIGGEDSNDGMLHTGRTESKTRLMISDNSNYQALALLREFNVLKKVHPWIRKVYQRQ